MSRALPLVALLVVGCGARSAELPGDATGAVTDGPLDALGPTPSWDYVLRGVRIPLEDEEARQTGEDLDGDGVSDNALGMIAAGLAGLGLAIDPNRPVNTAIAAGRALVLLRVTARDLTTAPQAQLHVWPGSTALGRCCTTPDDLAACRLEADERCFAGDRPFQVAGPMSALAGSIDSQQARFTGAKVQVRLALDGATTRPLTLLSPRIVGQISPGGIKGERLVGAIPQDEVDTLVIEGIAVMVDELYRSPDLDPELRVAIAGLFDSDLDGTISVDEVRQNGLVRSFLAGDVDVDGDNRQELSFGFAFDAVSARITE